MDVKKELIEWLFSGKTGMSSKALLSEYLGVEYEDQWFAPSDPADINRCLNLIDIEPKIRGCVDSLAKKHKQWKTAASCWDEMANIFREEKGLGTGCAVVTYKLMKKRGL